MKQAFANIVAILAVTQPAAVNSSRASFEARQRRLNRTKHLRAENANSSAAAESDNQARQEITHRHSGDHIVIDRENTGPEEELAGRQLRQKRSIRTTASTGSGEEESVGSSGNNLLGNTSIGSYVEIFDAKFSPLTQPAKVLDFDGSTYTLEHGLSGVKLERVHSLLVHPHEIYEAGSEVRCYNMSGQDKNDRQFSLACKQCSVTGHSQEADSEINYTVDCLNHDGFREKLMFPLTSLQRFLPKEL
ncbi:hypothetical protein THAOC_04338 [Thalassiosira oceanica]|uniref:Uncharacterized protein n=1 Tax=Thalassiosira oceanica TaxID=159749 RepID=K0TJB5_THAOC|nr:hypothetical protein THAOC_04338 [Thalassiosira oceanica]|eukprot:EJK74016.1 hypothetical protein THAOC_04338 [Thalassiosira oceanica]